jgi:hypothetical protein
MTAIRKYVIVQHSGYGYNGNPQFKQAVEVRVIGTVGEQRRVETVGGILFDEYMEAENFAEKANYPADNLSIMPEAKGTFSDLLIDGLRIYIPVRDATG